MTDLLVEQSEETLLEMRERVRGELARLTVEAQQIEEALAKKGRRSRGGGSGGGTVTRKQVLDVVEQAGVPMSPVDVQRVLGERGLDVTINAIRNHLLRLVQQNGALIRDEDGRYVPTEPVFFAASDDVPF